MMPDLLQRLLAGGFGAMERAYWDRTYDGYRRRHAIDPTFQFKGPGTELLGDHVITLGAGSYISARSMIVAYGAPITVGGDCRISRQVRIDGRSGDRVGPVVIGNGVLVGWNAYILPGVTIGDGAKIGANTVVHRDVPAGATVKSQMVPSE